MANLSVEIVAPDHFVWKGEAKSVTAKTPEGTLGVLPSHSPVLATLVSSQMVIDTVDEGKKRIDVSGGFFSMDSNNVTVVTDKAVIES